MSILGNKKSAIDRAKDIKELEDNYSNITVDGLSAIVLKDALAATYTEDSEFKAYIAADRLKLFGNLNAEEVRQDHEINMHLKKLEAMKKAAELYAPEYVKVHMDLVAMNSELKKIEDQDKINAAMTDNKLEDIKADGRTSRARKMSQTVSGLFKGFSDIYDNDIVYADNIVKWAQKEVAISKVDYTKKIWESVAASLVKNTKKHEYTVEQKNKLTEMIVKEILHQAENAK